MKNYIFLTILYCLFSFKYNLIPFADTGIRIDDFLILAFFLLIIAKGGNVTNRSINLMFVYTVWSLFSAIINMYVTEISILKGVLFSIRNVEYLLFFYVGYYYRFYQIPLTPLLKSYLTYSVVIVILIHFGFISGTSEFHISRVSSNTSGPYEYVIVVAFLTLYFTRNKNYAYGIVSFVMMFLTFSRITIAAYFIVQLFSSSLRLKVFLLFVFSLFLLMLENTGYPSLLNRFSSLIDNQTIQNIHLLYSNIELVDSHQGYLDTVYNPTSNSAVISLGGDSSALIRLNRWLVLVFSTTLLSPFSFFIGMGPSFASVGVDGNYIRIFAETGVVGLTLYLTFLWSVLNYAKKNNEKVLYRFVVIVAISALFIDIFVSYKVMLLFWFYFGYVFKKNSKTISNKVEIQ